MKWFVRRVIHAILLLGVVSLASFLMGRMAPGSFFDDLALNPQIRPETVARLRARYGLGESAPRRYAKWLLSAAKGDFGTSIAYQRPVAGILLPRTRNTLQLTLAALLAAWLIAIPWAILSARRPRGAFDQAGESAATFSLAVPELLLALALMFIAVRARQIYLIDSSILPITVLTAGAFPVVYQHARAALAEAAELSYVRAARAHGIAGPRLWIFFILPLAANPLISLFGWSIGGLIGASLIVETVFSRPGIGPLFLDAISSRDLDLVTAVMLLSACFLVAGNLLADLLIGICDPRIRMERR